MNSTTWATRFPSLRKRTGGQKQASSAWRASTTKGKSGEDPPVIQMLVQWNLRPSHSRSMNISRGVSILAKPAPGCLNATVKGIITRWMKTVRKLFQTAFRWIKEQAMNSSVMKNSNYRERPCAIWKELQRCEAYPKASVRGTSSRRIESRPPHHSGLKRGSEPLSIEVTVGWRVAWSPSRKPWSTQIQKLTWCSV